MKMYYCYKFIRTVVGSIPNHLDPRHWERSSGRFLSRSKCQLTTFSLKARDCINHYNETINDDQLTQDFTARGLQSLKILSLLNTINIHEHLSLIYLLLKPNRGFTTFPRTWKCWFYGNQTLPMMACYSSWWLRSATKKINGNPILHGGVLLAHFGVWR